MQSDSITDRLKVTLDNIAAVIDCRNADVLERDGGAFRIRPVRAKPVFTVIIGGKV
jgi:hypothetical protein